jgi:putative ABC transport system permease protein
MFAILRSKKILRDLWANRGRSVLTVVAMAVGMLGLSAVLCAYSILVRELDANYRRTNPASAIITTDAVDPGLLNGVRRLPGIGAVEARGLFPARILVGPNEWKTLLLFVVDDFSRMRISTSRSDRGQWPPRTGEILIERAAMRVVRMSVGETVKVRLPGSADQELKLAGTIHDPAQAPAWMEGLAYGYVGRETLRLFGVPALNEVLIQVSDRPFDREAISDRVQSVTAWMKGEGYRVVRVNIPEPGRHPHQTQLETLLFLLQAFGGLSFVLSGVLVFTLMGAIMSQQTRQIGIMKAIGATTGQMMVMYLGGALLLGFVAVVIAIPCGLLAARQYAYFAAKMLNFEIVDTSVPILAYALLAIVGLATPVVAALYPVWRGSHMPVSRALADYGIKAEEDAVGPFNRLIAAFPGISRPLILSLRNTFRRKGRVALTLATLAIGGAMFMTALNTGASIKKSLAVFQGSMRYDLKVTLARPALAGGVEPIVGRIPGVTWVEGWSQAKGSLVRSNATQGNEFTIMGPPPGTDLLRPRIVAGRWLTETDRNALVVNHIFMDQEPRLRVGNEVILRIGTTSVPVKIAGVMRQIGPPTAFMNPAYLAAITGQRGMVNALAVVTAQRTAEAHLAASRRIESALERTGYAIQEMISIRDIQRILEDHFVVLTTLLLVMATLIVIVGGLALSTTMSIQVIERTREIGVMRAIGASSRAILGIFLVEGLVVGLLSWVLAACLAIPISKHVADLFGMIFLRTTLDFAVSPLSFLFWLGIVLFFSLIATFLPAKRATRLTVRETLSYE